LKLIENAQNAEKLHEKTQEYYSKLRTFDGSSKSKEEIQKLLLSINAAGTTTYSSTKLHLYFALDDSGSMSGSPWRDLMEAVKACIQKRIDLCNKNGVAADDLVTIINHNSTSSVKCSAKLITTVDPYKDTRFDSGGNDFAIAFKMIDTEIAKLSSGYIPVLLFMSDGGCGNGEAELQKVVQNHNAKGLQIYFIGFGSGCSKQKMTNMALISNGKYHFGSNGVELKSEFEEISKNISSTMFAL